MNNTTTVKNRKYFDLKNKYKILKDRINIKMNKVDGQSNWKLFQRLNVKLDKKMHLKKK